MEINKKKQKAIIVFLILFIVFMCLQFLPKIVELFSSKSGQDLLNVIIETSEGKTTVQINTNTQRDLIVEGISLVGEIAVVFIGLFYFLRMDAKENKETIYKKGCINNLYEPYDCEKICDAIKDIIKQNKDFIIEVPCQSWNLANITNLKAKIYSYFSNEETQVLIPPDFQFENLNYVLAEADLKMKNNQDITRSIIICDDTSANKYELDLIKNNKNAIDTKKITIIYIRS